MSENYSEDTIKTLEWHEHIRLRPGMYIGKLGDGSSHDDGIYILLKETIDNSIDEFVMGNGKKIEIAMTEHSLEIRDYGRGIPLGKLKDVASKINTGAKYDDSVFKKTVGLNGVGLKAVNALSSKFIIQSTREGKTKKIEFNRGVFVSEEDLITPQEKNGTRVYFEPDTQLFGNFRFIDEYVQTMMRNYVYLNSGLTIKLNEQTFYSERGLFDLLTENMSTEPLYPIVQFRGPDIEVVILYRATTSLALYLQMCGRGSRVTDNKKSFTILDFGNNVKRLGFWHEDRVWSLKNPPKKKKGEEVPAVKECPQCDRLVPVAVSICPFCGFVFPVQKKKKTKEEVELVKLEYKEKKLQTIQDRYNEFLANGGSLREFLQTIKHDRPALFAFAKMKGYKAGWVHHQFNPTGTH